MNDLEWKVIVVSHGWRVAVLNGLDKLCEESPNVVFGDVIAGFASFGDILAKVSSFA